MAYSFGVYRLLRKLRNENECLRTSKATTLAAPFLEKASLDCRKLLSLSSSHRLTKAVEGCRTPHACYVTKQTKFAEPDRKCRSIAPLGQRHGRRHRQYQSKTMKALLQFTIHGILILLSLTSALADEVVHYDTLDHAHPPLTADRSTKITLNNDVAGARDAQAFVASGDNVTSVTLGLGRRGMSGQLRFEIWDTTSSGRPSEMLGVLGEIEYNTITEVPSWPSAPNYLEEYTIEGKVSGLTPGETYALVLYLVGNDGSAYRYGYGAVDGPEEYEIMEMWGQELGKPWVPMSTFFNPNIDYYLRAKISGTAPTKPLQLDIEPAVAISWDSQADRTYEIHSSTDLESWTVTVDAIQGTGERLTHFFVREDTRIYYRVEESQ